MNKKLIIVAAFLLFQFSFSSCNAVEPDEILNNTQQENRARDISKNIRCMVCQNQSIDDSSAPLAKDLRVLIRSKIKKGDKDEDIYKFLSDRYGDFILLKPPLKLGTVFLWFSPAILFLIGIFVIIKHNNKAKVD